MYIKKSQEKLKDHRSLAVDSHNNTAQKFAGEYRSLAEHDYFASAFLFGRGKIPQLMGDMAKGIKSFKRGMNDEEKKKDKNIEKKTDEDK